MEKLGAQTTRLVSSRNSSFSSMQLLNHHHPRTRAAIAFYRPQEVQRMMLPPVDPRILERNPNFEVLYKDLTARKLNADGSTRDTKKQRIHDEIRRVR